LYGASKTLKNGTRIPYYDANGRKNGIIMITIAVLSILWFLYRLISFTSNL
jgi:hypothetical protein